MLFVPTPALPHLHRSLTPKTTTRPHVFPHSCAQPPSDDWRAFRARLIRSETGASSEASLTSFAHTLHVPEPGALLLANPAFFTRSQIYFRRAVILLFAHNSLQGSAGLLLNKRGAAEGGAPTVPWGTVRLGGDVGLGTLFAVYPTPGGGRGVIEGVTVGGLQEVVEMVESERLDKRDVKFYSRYCGWGPAQLESEIERGVWYLAAASKEFVLGDGEGLYEQITSKLGIGSGEGG